MEIGHFASHIPTTEHNRRAPCIRAFMVMITVVQPLLRGFRLPVLRLRRRQRRATMDLIHASPYLRKDIVLLEEHFFGRRR